jgi:MFS family permease
MTQTTTASNAIGSPGWLEEGWSARHVVRVIILVLAGEWIAMSYLFPGNVISLVAGEFHTDQAALVISGITFASAAAAPVMGRLGDRFGKRKVIIIMMVTAVAGSLLVAFATTFALVVIGRCIQGVGLGLIAITSSLARDIFPPKTRSLAISLAVTGTGALTILTALAIGPIIAVFGWRGVFWVPAVYGIVVTVLVLAIVPETQVRDKVGKLDWPGAIFLGGGIALTLLPITFSRSWGWGNPVTIGLLVVGIILLICWLITAFRVKSPLIAIREFGYPPLAITFFLMVFGIVGGTLITSFRSYVVLTPASAGLGYGLGVPAANLGFFTAINSLGTFIAAFTIGGLLRRVQPPVLLIVATITLAIGYVVAILSIGSIAGFLVAMLLVGLASGSIPAITYNVVARTVTARRQASTAAAIAVGGNIGGTITPVILLTAMNGAAAFVNGTPIYSASLIRVPFIVAGCYGLIMLVLSLALAAYQRRNGGLRQVDADGDQVDALTASSATAAAHTPDGAPSTTAATTPAME